MDSNEKRSYAQMRLANAGITEGNMIFPVKFFDQPIKKKVNLFSEDKSGNLKIRYVDLDGDHEYFLEKNRPKEFFRTRLKNPVDEMKYFQPRNSEKHVYWTPTIINKYQEGKQIETLFITEGEIKAFVGHLQGLDIAGIGGIHNFSNQKENRLLPEIEKLIEKCQVRNIVLLFDADCLSITFKEGKDLYQRPNSFYSAVKKFKELTAPLNVDVYFSHIKSEFEEKAKGLDDLLLYPETNVDELIRELHSLSVNKNRKYIHSLSISENSIYALRKYFAIDKVASFYLKYASILQESEFIFQGSKYKHNGDKLEMLQHKDAKLYLRVGCDYYKEVSKINSRGDYENVLKKWRIGEIKRDYEQKGIKNFIDQIAKYDEFCNIPDNTENYKRQYVLPNYTTNYNLYEPINHPIKEGRIDNTTMFLKHLFTPTSRDSPEYGDPFLIALDYLTILYQHPHHLLPIICLVSKEQGTGKTTFLKWLKAIYKSNATILGNSEFNLDFNTHYINKLLIMIDESFIELD
ncbi:MAG: DUF3854 domain-containing protein, partial [Bacteroidales bacterium]|nr:DUF3854 domain-containing protein [Bacteroidales bacterium]MCF8457176.1 DUF3854 domain-containing protein [Bacteroidales bacterium]